MNTPTTSAVPVEVVEAIQAEHRRELANLEARMMYYRALLAEHGVTVHDAEDDRVRWDSDEHYAGCVQIVDLAYRLLDSCDRFRNQLGTARELIDRQPWRRP